MSTRASAAPGPLRISAFRDITAFILDGLAADQGVPLEVHYVRNADEAHGDLTERRADIVFMSYDDTLSLGLEDGYSDIAAFLPVHGGILDLCGSLEPAGGAVRIGIDTDSGYARALRLFLRDRLGPERYSQLAWIKAGATNLRAEQLAAGEIDATLLNPPFSCAAGVARIAALTGSPAIPRYQGVVANLNRRWLEQPGRRDVLAAFVAAYGERIQGLWNQPEASVEALSRYYAVATPVAAAIYERLRAADGLDQTPGFATEALAATERIFAEDTGIAVPPLRHWLLAAVGA